MSDRKKNMYITILSGLELCDQVFNTNTILNCRHQKGFFNIGNYVDSGQILLREGVWDLFCYNTSKILNVVRLVTFHYRISPK